VGIVYFITMTRDDLYNATIDIYNELYRQATLVKDFKLTIRAAEDKLLNKFVDFMFAKYSEDAITIDLLIRYFQHQFSRYVGVRPPKHRRTHGRNTILIHWLIGKKAFEDWNEREVNKNWLVRLRVNKEFTLKLHKAFAVQIHKAKVEDTENFITSIDRTEENVKLKFYNKPEGLTWCTTITTLFKPVSELCCNCIHKEYCKIILRNEFPNIYKKRLENA
jgi:hypothetical protein